MSSPQQLFIDTDAKVIHKYEKKVLLPGDLFWLVTLQGKWIHQRNKNIYVILKKIRKSTT